MLADFLVQHREMGRLIAHRNWSMCADPGGRTRRSKDLDFEMLMLQREMDKFAIYLRSFLSECDFEQLCRECKNETVLCVNEYETEIAKEYIPHGISFNDRALIVMTDTDIPDDVKIGLSFGWKFLFPYVTTDENIHSVLAQLDHCIEQTIPELRRTYTYRMVSKILEKRSDIHRNDVVQWLCFVALRTKRFLNENRDIFATKSDKGGHTVVIDTVIYDECLAKMLNTPDYEGIGEDPLKALAGAECKLIRFFMTNYKTKGNDVFRRFGIGFQPALLTLAKFYGLPKIHKKEFCLRPITAMNGAPGFAVGKIFDRMLNLVFPRTEFHIVDTLNFKNFLGTIKLGESEVLVSFDVVAMFTSIPRTLVYRLVMARSEIFLDLFGIGKVVLKRILDFLLSECTVFTALDGIFKQKVGLPMGSCISPTLARIVMDEVVIYLLDRVPKINFIRVFVDDTVTVMDKESVDEALRILNEFDENIKFTCEMENEQKSINFLNLTLMRDGTEIITNWYRKGFASGRLLNFLSSHKRTTVLETARNFILTTIELSDGRFFHANRNRVIDTLRDNCFPEDLISILMNENYTLMRKRRKPKLMDGEFYVYPHAVCESSKIKRILHKFKKDKVIYAESTKNTKINFVKTRKTITPKKLKGNVIISSNCRCGKRSKIMSAGFNQNAGMTIELMKTTFRKCENGLHSFRRFKIWKGLAYRAQTDYLAKYVQWKLGASCLNTNTGRPNYYFGKLLRNNGVK